MHAQLTNQAGPLCYFLVKRQEGQANSKKIPVVLKLCHGIHHLKPIPVAARSKPSAFSRALAGIVGSNPAAAAGGGHGCLSLVSVVCCQVEVSATGRSPVQRSPTDCGVCLCVIK
jgi:hypothetical protein